MKSNIHGSVGILGFLLIAGFWLSTLFSELLLSHEYIELVKRMILYLMWILIPILILTGISGFVLSKRRSDDLLIAKRKRMPIIALNGLLILLPSAIYLHDKATIEQFDSHFYLVQTIELIAGMVNMILIGTNIRDGLRLSGRRLLAMLLARMER